MNNKGFAPIAIIVLVVVIVGVISYIAMKKPETALASVTVISPKEEEPWTVGTKQIIKWSSTNIPEKASIEIQLANPDLDEDGFWGVIAGGLPNSGEYTWEIPKTIKNGPYKIYIYAQGTERLDVIHDDVVIHVSGSTAVSPKISKVSPSSGSLPPAIVTEVTNKNEVKEIIISGSGFNTERKDDFSKNDIYFSSGPDTFALFRKPSPDGLTLTIPLPSNLGAGKITEDVVPGTYEIFVETASGKSNSITFVVEVPDNK